MQLVPKLVLASVVFALAACGSTEAQRVESSLQVPRVPMGDLPVMERTILSKNYHIDRKYRSMVGPSSLDKVKLLETKEPELLWIVGYKAIVMDQEGDDQVSQEFMCHSNLDFEPKDYWENFKSDASMSGRLFTLSQGQQDVKFPDGHGIPVMSDMELGLATQVLNLNLPDPKLDVRHKVTIRFVRDAESHGMIKPLFQAAVQGFKSLEDRPGDYGVKMDPAEEGNKLPGLPEGEHAGCSVGMAAVKGDVDKDAFGQKFTGHWVVKPGREVNRTLVTKFLQLQFDTTIHYIAVHLHPFAESLELIDKTEGKTVFKAFAKNHADKIGIHAINHFESVEGVPIYKDHDYELISIYNNTSSEDQDSMAVMYLYLHDRHFSHPEPAKEAKR